MIDVWPNVRFGRWVTCTSLQIGLLYVITLVVDQQGKLMKLKLFSCEADLNIFDWCWFDDLICQYCFTLYLILFTSLIMLQVRHLIIIIIYLCLKLVFRVCNYQMKLDFHFLSTTVGVELQQKPGGGTKLPSVFTFCQYHQKLLFLSVSSYINHPRISTLTMLQNAPTNLNLVGNIQNAS